MIKLNRLLVTEWQETHPEYNLARDPAAYVVSSTPNNFRRYDVASDYYYMEELEDNNLEDITLDNDSFGFWSDSGDPLQDLAKRIFDFENLCLCVLDNLDKKTNILGMTLRSLPKERTDRFTVDFLKAWLEVVHKESLNIPNELESAELHLESLFYKWRKMVELYENVCNSYGMKEALYKML
ncbi:MAG: hypothetical protein GY861_02405 [bacterium]|nr:hypothetical protein [bacterium]